MTQLFINGVLVAIAAGGGGAGAKGFISGAAPHGGNGGGVEGGPGVCINLGTIPWSTGGIGGTQDTASCNGDICSATYLLGGDATQYCPGMAGGGGGGGYFGGSAGWGYAGGGGGSGYSITPDASSSANSGPNLADGDTNEISAISSWYWGLFDTLAGLWLVFALVASCVRFVHQRAD